MADVDRPDYWEDLYRTAGDGWELGAAAPPFAAWLDSADGPRAGRAVVPACGRGHEVLALAERGVAALGLDFAPSAIAAARAAAARHLAAGRLRAAAEFRQVDLFDAAVDPELAGRFDLAVEHTAFCAIDPARRDEYVDALHALLAPGGRLVGLFYSPLNPGGPPFATDAAEVERRFGRRFVVKEIARAEGSVERRRGQELFARMSRR